MRKLVSLALAAIAASVAVPAQALDGGVAIPTAGVGRAHRCASSVAGPGSQGALGWSVNVTPGAAFELKATGGSASVQDFDIDFYVAFTPCEQGAVTTFYQHENVDGDEAGIVPSDATLGVVRLHRGVAGSFSYTEAPQVSVAPKGKPRPVIAVIDTGLMATHQEFDYCGCGTTTTGLDSDPSDQIDAWWDFSREDPSGPRLPAGGVNLPAPGQTWDDRVAHPYDNHGHGTGTASLAAGSNSDPVKDLSFAPGYDLAIAKVGEGDGTISGSIVEAIRWAIDTVKADVVTMSIGAIVPLPPALAPPFHREAARARDLGILVVVSNGNGFANASVVPGEPGWATPYGYSTDVLSVGAGGHLPYNASVQTGYQATTDGEVTAKYTAVGMAAIGCDSCYENHPGTSFSAPLVAGMAAALINEVKPAKFATPDYIEKLLKFSARDTQAPPNFDGYGRLDYHQFVNVARPNARARSLPSRPSPDVSGMYVEQVGGTLRDTWTNTLDVKLPESLALKYLVPLAPSVSGQGAIGTSAPTGAAEGEVYTFSTTAGTPVSITIDFVSDPVWTGLADSDSYVFLGTDPNVPGAYSSLTEVTKSTNGAGVSETISFVPAVTGSYQLMVVGWTVVEPQRFTITSSVPLTFDSEDYFLNNYGGVI